MSVSCSVSLWSTFTEGLPPASWTTLLWQPLLWFYALETLATCDSQPFGRAQYVGPLGHTSLGLHSGLDNISGPRESAFSDWDPVPTAHFPATAPLLVPAPTAAELVYPVRTSIMLRRLERSNVRASTNFQEARLTAHNSFVICLASQNPSCLRAVSTETSTISIKIQEAKQ